jgi:hypothetical protein
MNKFKYFTQGINSILEGGCKNLSQGIEFIAIDDNVIHGDELPSSIESIVFSNIPAYAGTRPLFVEMKRCRRLNRTCATRTCTHQMVRTCGAAHGRSRT